MDFDKMLRLSRALKLTAKAATLLQIAVVGYAAYKAVRIAWTMVDGKKLLG